MPPVVKNLLLINVLMYVITLITGNFMYENFALFYFKSPFFKPFQLVTHMFMHGGFTHIFFNMYTLFIFGSVLERVWGSQKFLLYYFVTGIGAALLHLGVMYLQLQGYLAAANAGDIYATTQIQSLLCTPTVGASGSYWCPRELVMRFFHLELLTPDRADLFRGTNRILKAPISRENLEALIGLHRNQSYYASLKLKQLLYAILVDLYGQLSQAEEPVPTYSDHVRDTVSYIHSHLSAQLTVEELAQRREISHTTLNNCFRRELGMTVGQYIDDRLLIEARSLLCHSDQKIARISAALGFSDQFYFSNKFKSRTGYTPLQYRKVNGWRALDE